MLFHVVAEFAKIPGAAPHRNSGEFRYNEISPLADSGARWLNRIMEQGSAVGPEPRWRGRWVLAALLLTATLGGAGVMLLPRAQAPPAGPAPLPDWPDSPFLNTRPSVAYVGDEACGGCHRQISDSYHRHPMGR